jgi:hypothetical protein
VDPQTDKSQSTGTGESHSPGTRPLDGSATPQRGSVITLLRFCAILLLVLLPFAGGVAWFGLSRSGQPGLVAAAIALGTCWLSGSLALAATLYGQRLGSALHGVLIGMFFRMGLPLAVGLILQRTSPPLSEAGVFVMILGLYLVALVVETFLSLQFVPRGVAPKDGSGATAKPIEVLGVQSR